MRGLDPFAAVVAFCAGAVTLLICVCFLSLDTPRSEAMPVVAAPRSETMPAPAYSDALVDELKQEEGFKPRVYRDKLGGSAIGYGTNLDVGITKAEAEYLLLSRLRAAWDCIVAGWPPYTAMAATVQEALLDAAYNLGCSGLLGFHEALAALADGNCDLAANNFRDSKWAVEVPHRVERVVARLDC